MFPALISNTPPMDINHRNYAFQRYVIVSKVSYGVQAS